MQFPQQQQQYGALPAQCQQCLLTPGYSQPQQQYFPNSGYYPQQNFNNPYQQQQYPFYPQQQQQQQYPFYPQQQQQQYPFYPQQQQQYSFYPQQQFQFYPQQQQQQQWPNLAQGLLGQNAYGYQQYWPQQQHRVFERRKTPTTSPARHEQEKPKKVYERLYS
ncbi:hypothetical protein I4U23_013370 [Adineta vaga]|nr:hypothetical protein I4U23_013370 [Adineta vaga]